MAKSVKNSFHFPLSFPMNFSGKLTSKIVIKDDYIRADGTCAVYAQIFLNKIQKRISLQLSVKPTDFDKVKQRVKVKAPNYKDYNLLIEQALASINEIEINYRLSKEVSAIF